MFTTAISIVPLIFCFVAYVCYRIPSKRGVFAPGPPSHPLVGHTFQVPTTKVWKYFEKLGLTYGPLVRLTLAGDDILVLNHPADAEELLGKRSHNYSSRKQLVYAGKYLSQNKRLLLLPYGQELKTQRAAYHQMLQPRMIGSYDDMQEIESTKLLLNVLNHPEESNLNMNRYGASLVFTLSYGRRLADDDQDLMEVLAVLDNLIADCYPGAHLVDTFPIFDRILPSFLAPWRSEAIKKHEKERTLYTRLALDVKQRMESGEPDLECFAARLWEQQTQLGLDVTTIGYLAGSAFEAGTGTVAASLLWFLVAMIQYPETLGKAQAEIDGVLGSDGETMPSYQHMNLLPYTAALTKEVFRWMPVAPGGFPHYSDQEDEYKGFKIKAHTMVIPCIWSMHHNPSIFPDPLEFNPDRFLDEKVGGRIDNFTEGHCAFGFGRRICPGRHLGSRSVWIGIARLLWAFHIGPIYDTAGNPLPIDLDRVTSGITSEPEPFPVDITPRSEAHSKTIRREWKNQLESQN